MTESRFLQELALQEPKKVFVNMILIPYMREVNAILYSDRPSHAVRPIRQMISSLDEQGQKDLADILRRLESIEKGSSGLYDILELEHFWQRITIYLHQNFLREFGIRAINPNPKHIGSEE